MTLRKYILLATAALLPALAACDQQAPTAVADVARPTSIIDASTGEPVAINQPTADRIITIPNISFGEAAAALPACNTWDPSCGELCGIDDPSCGAYCDPIYDYGCEPCPRDNPYAWCYTPPCTIASIIDTYSLVRTGVDPMRSPEASGLGSTSCGGYLMLIGIGMRMDTNDNITTLHLKYQRVYADGTFGPTELRRYGSSPTHSLEAYAEALPGEAIVGVGVGTRDTEEIRTLRIWKRPITLTSTGVRTTGSVTAESFGVTPGGVLDTSYVIPLENTNQVYVGFGANAGDEKVKMAGHYIGTLK